MNIFSSPLDLYLAGLHQLNAQKVPSSLLSSASFPSQFNSLNQQKIYSSLLSTRQHQAEYLDDSSLYTYDPIKKMKPNNPGPNSMANPHPYFQEGVASNREYLNKLASNHSGFPVTGPFGHLKNSQPYQQTFPNQHLEEKTGSFIDLESDDEDCLIVEKPILNQPPVPIQNFSNFNYHNVNLPLSDLGSHHYFNDSKTAQFNRPQFNTPFPNNMRNYSNNFYPQNVKLEQSPVDFSHQRSVMNNFNYNQQQINKALMIEDASHDDYSNSTANSSSDYNKSLVLEAQKNNYFMQMLQNNRNLFLTSQFEKMQQPVWDQTQNSSVMNFDSQNTNSLKINTKEMKEKKKTKRKPRSPKKIMEPIVENALTQAEIKPDEPYIIELHIDPNDPNPNVCDTMVGEEYQAGVLPLVLNKRTVTEKRAIKCRWDPDSIERERLEEYFVTLDKKTEIEITNEIAKIKLLKENNLDIEKSLEEVDKNLIYFKGVLKLTKRRGRRSK